ncbi:MAG: hypothetical protein A2015_02200 [Spirochaetes bacterium GWF1_31_7]|nr:MAG: hypothetical protein A2Y30_06050 [Spirochaetes bacterium GWE1_32_154]OHD50727.1 MAG: hypothetical protein A2015_02200 [Spirochaetes bacterium GWF1_31_7]HBD95063.1 hypothetical protein [Spirochaetia bacterium]HBI38051.1 hypothetical protein [Spirochaetia bacterium]
MYSALTIANKIIELSQNEGRVITHLKLQKILYFSQGWYLALTGNPLFSDEIVAFKYGPVIKSIYEIFRIFGSKNITKIAESTEQVENKDNEFINKIWNLYKNHDAISLSNISHIKNGPWDVTNINDIITTDIIQNYFTGKLNAN